MLGKRLCSCSSLAGPRISPLAAKYGYSCPSLRIMAFVRLPLKEEPMQTTVVFHHSLLDHSRMTERLAWSIPIYSRSMSLTTGPSPGIVKGRTDRQARPTLSTDTANGVPCPVQGRSKSDYEPFNCNNFNIRCRSWNFRGCWHQTCPPIDPSASLCVALIPNAGPRQRGPASLVLVSTSLAPP